MSSSSSSPIGGIIFRAMRTSSEAAATAVPFFLGFPAGLREALAARVPVLPSTPFNGTSETR
eukprot:CAMPEP_0172678444 /NCGR_PEP_ID=MMETSP1074-20121228/15415_1 /TAXON_ID=2916 /ORGANISM="Ceratium fusus, Strain PA161109" /LENGTH=61 /DNA_ID=CAMNT_0013496493 /DNA_START=850 /DNA_END=1035 /DNA_ORIENTATION=+